MSDQPLSEDNNQASYGTNAGGGAPQGPQASRKMQATKAQVDEVVDIMRNNVEAVLERDAKISVMDDRADALHQGASQFETQAAKLKNKFWLENMKYMIALGVVVVIVIGVAVYKYKDQVVSTVDSLTPAKSVGGPGGPMGGQPVTEIPQEIMNQENPGQSMESPNFETPPQPQSEQISKPDIAPESVEPGAPENAEAG